MPYCPRCGTKQDPKIKNCILCNTSIPELEEESKFEYAPFPLTQNITRKLIIRLKNQIFFTISIILSTSILIILFLNYYGIMSEKIFFYATIVLVSIWAYLFVFFGFLKRILYSIIGFHFITLIMLLSLDRVNGKIEWFTSLGLPIALLSLITTTVGFEVYMSKKNRNYFVYIPIFLLLASAFFNMGLELILDYKAFAKYTPSWSIVNLIISSGLALIFYGLYKRLPDRIKNKIKWKFHI